MTTRRELLIAAIASLPIARAVAAGEKTGPLEVTYYYLPG
jgi:hypothetical protein